MERNKIIFGGEVLVDMTGDTASASDILSGKTAHISDGSQVEGTCTFDSDTSDATASKDDLLLGKTAYVRGAKVEGEMPNNGAISAFISSRTQQVTVPYGFHDGSGKVSIAAAEQEKIVPANIRKDITILGIVGTMTGTEDVNAQEKTVTPSKNQQVVSPDTGYNYLSQVIVNAIPYTETENAAGGITVTIGG